jgi:hypothetical protein
MKRGMMSAIIALEGVLKTETGDPIPEGIKLFRILSEFYRVIISSDMDTAKTEHWLRSHMIVGYGEIYDSSLFFCLEKNCAPERVEVAKY